MAEEEYNKGGYESLVWIRDKDGKEYACTAAALKGNIKTKEELTEEERELARFYLTRIGDLQAFFQFAQLALQTVLGSDEDLDFSDITKIELG